jgi:phosphoserine phosphatase RsbU/P
MTKCYSCGRTIEEREAYARLPVGDELCFICCPMCMTALEAGYVQMRIIPRSFSNDQLDAFVEYSPALRVGGDYACLRWLGRKKLYAIMADIAGHGVASSLIMSRLSGQIEGLVDSGTDLSSMAQALNRSVRSLAGEQHFYLTLFASILEFGCGALSFVNCGHPRQLLWRYAERTCIGLEPSSIPVGLFGPERFGTPQTETVQVRPNDKLILFTDGVLDLEPEPQHEIGEPGLIAAVRPWIDDPTTQCGERVSQALKALQNRECGDDLLLVLLNLKQMSSE